MAALRWILLVAGVVFLAALAAWELRKPRQAHRDAKLRAARRNDPELGSFPESAGEGNTVPATRGEAQPAGAAGRRPVAPPTHIDLPAADVFAPDARAPADAPAMDLPAMDLPVMAASRDEAMMAEVDALPVFEFHAAAQDEPPAPAALPPILSGDIPAPLVVDWPPDGERQIVALRIVAPAEERLSGRAVRLAITACGFVHGRFGIYHQPDTHGRALLSIASLVKPGILDPINMDFQRLPGISLFTVLPGPLPPPAAFDRLLDVARELAQRLPARLQDEQGEPLDSERIEALRASMQRLSRPGWQAEPAA